MNLAPHLQAVDFFPSVTFGLNGNRGAPVAKDILGMLAVPVGKEIQAQFLVGGKVQRCSMGFAIRTGCSQG
jgi:hypothetical protein